MKAVEFVVSQKGMPIEVRQQVSVILASIGTQSALNALIEHLLDADSGFAFASYRI
jgi:hypothetical protein